MRWRIKTKNLIIPCAQPQSHERGCEVAAPQPPAEPAPAAAVLCQTPAGRAKSRGKAAGRAPRQTAWRRLDENSKSHSQKERLKRSAIFNRAARLNVARELRFWRIVQLWSNFNLSASSLLCTPSRNLNSFLRQLLAELSRRERENLKTSWEWAIMWNSHCS